MHNLFENSDSEAVEFTFKQDLVCLQPCYTHLFYHPSFFFRKWLVRNIMLFSREQISALELILCSGWFWQVPDSCIPVGPEWLQQCVPSGRWALRMVQRRATSCWRRRMRRETCYDVVFTCCRLELRGDFSCQCDDVSCSSCQFDDVLDFSWRLCCPNCQCLILEYDNWMTNGFDQ